ncbi:hypothetical protein GCM10023156_61270 [Novipirellula rosea]|uniref:HAMP domain-containing protein n=2 Tax=Novipirellula rosea TaxID=1031540 RepID=A0ABP8NLL8_9BACT
MGGVFRPAEGPGEDSDTHSLKIPSVFPISDTIMSKRTRFLVDPKVQWSIAARVAGHWAIFLMCLVSINVCVRVFAAVIHQPLWDALQSALVAQAPIVVVMFVLLPVFLRDTLVMSNRFAGPMYRLRTALAALAGGESIKAIKFRTGDFWLSAADDFNLVLVQLNSLKDENEQLRNEIDALRNERVGV